MYFIGVDLGTSATKLLLMDELGAIRKIVSRSYPLSMPRPGWSEQDPEAWIEAAFSGIRELFYHMSLDRILFIALRRGFIGDIQTHLESLQFRNGHTVIQSPVIRHFDYLRACCQCR